MTDLTASMHGIDRGLHVSGEPVVVVSDLSKRYGDVPALDGLSFEIPASSVTGLLGPNGSGKTTTVAILSTALRPTGGAARICGLDVVSQAADVRRRIGFAGQFAAVDPNLTGQENLRLIGRLTGLPRQVARDRAEELLARFRLTDAAHRLVRTYSGGMRRRLDVGAALVHKPPVLFLDEPTTGLDPESRLQLWELVRDLVKDGATVLLTTQYLEEADALADQVVIINRGRAVKRGTPRELREQIGSAVVRLTFSDERGAVQAEQALAEDFSPERTGAEVRVSGTEGSAVVVRIVRALDGVVPDPVAVEVREPTLDDAFLALTGNGAQESVLPESSGAS